MAGIDVKSFRSPDETRPFQGKGKVQLVHFGEATAGLGTFEPGWRWSTNVKPIAGTSSCQAAHFGYCLSGKMIVRMDNGEEREIKAGDSFMIDPGHDGWVVGDEACVMVDFSGFADYAQARREIKKGTTAQVQPSIH